MRHLTAVHVEIDGVEGWHYASASRRGGYPLGHCAEHPPHPSEDEARACYRRWQREHVKPRGTSSWSTCDAGRRAADAGRCPDPAKHTWTIEGDAYALAVVCEAHNNRQAATTALGLDEPLAGDAWQS